MRCSKCGSDNREGRKFCVQCGQALKLACPSCGAPSEPAENWSYPDSVDGVGLGD